MRLWAREIGHGIGLYLLWIVIGTTFGLVLTGVLALIYLASH